MGLLCVLCNGMRTRMTAQMFRGEEEKKKKYGQAFQVCPLSIFFLLPKLRTSIFLLDMKPLIIKTTFPNFPPN